MEQIGRSAVLRQVCVIGPNVLHVPSFSSWTMGLLYFMWAAPFYSQSLVTIAKRL